MTTNNQPSLHAVLGSIEVEGVNSDGKQVRSSYSVRLYVDKNEAAKSANKPASSVVKWEWDADNQISYEPSSMIKIVLSRGFGTSINALDRFVGQYKGNFADLLDTDTSVDLADKKGNPVPLKMKIALSRVSTGDTQDNAYLGIGGPPPVAVTHETGMKAAGGIVSEGLKRVLDALYDCSDVFPPLKSTAAGFRTIIKFAEAVSGNKQELENLETKLGAILSIVEKYRQEGGVDAVTQRIEDFNMAITVQLEAVKALQGQSAPARVALVQSDADAILKILRNIISLCDIFQIDTQLNIDITVGKVLQYMNSRSIEKLNHEMTSYKTRMSSYGDPTGCMQGTRVKVLEDLDVWASDPIGSKVYWMIGMAGIGKSTVAHTFCETLEAKNMLCGSFFASRASEKTTNACLIIPVIAYALARSSPTIKYKVVKAIENDSTLAEPTYINMSKQFKQLILDPVQITQTSGLVNIHKVVVIDAVDECSNIEVVASFIELILQLVSEIPFKVFISSREDRKIRNAFYSAPYLAKSFYLHNIEEDVVQKDIHRYLELSLAKIKSKDYYQSTDPWPSQIELGNLVLLCGTLFIYAATAMRYIAKDSSLYKERFTKIAGQGLGSVTNFKANIDGLYIHILEMAFEEKEQDEVKLLRDILSIIIFLCHPLPIQAIESLLHMNVLSHLSPLASVIYLPDPDNKEAVVAPFHASFPDFITSSTRCSPEHFSSMGSLFHPLDASTSHQLLALKCLQLMNQSLKYNMCNIPQELTFSHRERTNSPEDAGKISAAIKYACTHWATHLAEFNSMNKELANALYEFLHKHLLHWIECLSIIGELQTGVKSLASVAPVLSHSEYSDLQMLVADACKCIQMSFYAIQRYCMEIYQSALVWIPENSLVRKTYHENVCKVPKVIIGLHSYWGSTELVIPVGSQVNSVEFSQDGHYVVSGSSDGKVRIWNVTTGAQEAELKGHRVSVQSVTFSKDGYYIASGSSDNIVCIWNVKNRAIEAKLQGHTDRVQSVAFSQDGYYIASGASDNTIWIWNFTTMTVEAELKGHTGTVCSVAFSYDGHYVISGSLDGKVLIWNLTTQAIEDELKGHRGGVESVAFSQNGLYIACGGADKIVWIWNAITKAVEAKLKGHTGIVQSVAFSQNSHYVVSGADDKTVQIWNIETKAVEAELKGHTSSVKSVAFSQDGHYIVSGSLDKTIRIWNLTTSMTESEPKGHTSSVHSIAFSQDGNYIVSGSSDGTVLVWDLTTGTIEAELKDHIGPVDSVAFSHDGHYVVSGSADKTVRIWNIITRAVEAELNGHTNKVKSVAFSQDGHYVVSGSDDATIRIWSATTGALKAVLDNSMAWVQSVAFSPDGHYVASGSADNIVRIWDVATGIVEAELKGHTHHAWPVAFSQSGHYVVSGSIDGTVRVWNIKTHSYQIVSSKINLPDSSIVYTTSSVLQVFEEKQWIVRNYHHCWIPTEYSCFSNYSVSGSRVCLVYNTGLVLVLDMATAL